MSEDDQVPLEHLLTRISDTEIQAALSSAVDSLAHTAAGVAHGADQDLTEEHRRNLELLRVAVLRRVTRATAELLEDTTGYATLYGASAGDVARAAGLGGSAQAHKKWRGLGRFGRQRTWLLRNRDRLISDAAAFAVLADRMHMDAHGRRSVETTQRHLISGTAPIDMKLLLRLMVVHVARWAEVAAPDPEDMGAVAAVQRLRALTDDYHLFVHKTPRRGWRKE